MKLKKLLQEVVLTLFRGNKEVEITGITENSKKVSPGNLFIARKGSEKDGSHYVEEALKSGAHAILVEKENPLWKDVVQLVHPRIRDVEGKIAAAFYGHPSKELFTIGITGTNGKTTISYMLKQLLEEVNTPTGLIGTIECIIGDKSYPSEMTTPDVITNHKLLREMLNAGASACVMEVTSHGLVQGRVDEIDFDCAIFTNLTQDHLDYHATMEEYAEAKRLLFRGLSPSKWAIINGDDPYGKKMLEGSSANVLTYGFSPSCDLVASGLCLHPQGTQFDLSYKGQRASFAMPLIGRHNVYNALAAMGVLLTKGIPMEALPTLIKGLTPPPGRLERVGQETVFVDYAHTPDALQNVLTTLRELVKGKIITVFGCGGDRDRKKRPLMAEIAERYSDYTLVTSDNPRTEDPKEILKEIVKGFKKGNFNVVEDRKEAIVQAISLKGEEDLVLIAGKGHETYQIFAHKRLFFDDRKVAKEALEK